MVGHIARFETGYFIPKLFIKEILKFENLVMVS